MQLFPTRATFHVALAGAAGLVLGVLAGAPNAVQFMGAMLVAVAFGRALDRAGVARLRSSGFEMVWLGSKRASRLVRGNEIAIDCELRNRSDMLVRTTRVRAVASSLLDVRVEPEALDIPAWSRTRVTLHVSSERVGRWGIHGVGLEVRSAMFGGEGLFEIPLLFANPYGVEVVPNVGRANVAAISGARSRRIHVSGRSSNLRGDGEELREIRKHSPGDAFKRIAWKASAKRGELLVREMEREERDVAWIVIESSVELWAGTAGASPLDRMIDDAFSMAERHLRRGDPVGLAVVGARLRSYVAARTGRAHGPKLAAALTSASNFVDLDRTELLEEELASLTLEHLRPLVSGGVELRGLDLPALSTRAEAFRSRAPFSARAPFALNGVEQRFRHYLACFGIEVSPKTEGEGARARETLIDTLERIRTERMKPSIVYVWAQNPGGSPRMVDIARKLSRQRVKVRWSLPPSAATLLATPDSGATELWNVRKNTNDQRSVTERAVFDAVLSRSAMAERDAALAVRSLGFALIPSIAMTGVKR